MQLTVFERYIDELIEKSTLDVPVWNIEKALAGKAGGWNYIDGCMILALLETYQATGKKKYYVDLYFEIDSWTENVGVVVECDGYEFHQKSKKQVEYDNEREYEIKKCGFDILRFSGSKIYNDPFKCANDIFDYLLLKEKK